MKGKHCRRPPGLGILVSHVNYEGAFFDLRILAKIS